MNTKKQDNKKRYTQPRPDTPHEAFIFDYKQLLKKIRDQRKNIKKRDESTITKTIAEAMKVRKELKKLCDEFLSDHPDEDNKILAHFLQLDSFYERFAGAQYTIRELQTKNAKQKDQIEALTKELDELRNAEHHKPPTP